VPWGDVTLAAAGLGSHDFPPRADWPIPQIGRDKEQNDGTPEGTRIEQISADRKKNYFIPVLLLCLISGQLLDLRSSAFTFFGGLSMSMFPTCYGSCAGPLGFPMTDRSARALEAILKTLPGGQEFSYRHLVTTRPRRS